MQEANKLGMNRTGMDMSPMQAKAMLKGNELSEVGPAAHEALDQMRKAYMSVGDSVGSVPLPGSAKGVVSSGMEKLKGHSPEILINKLGQRLAFERAGVRLYDALIFKCEAAPDEASQKIVQIDKLKQFRHEEAEHFLIVKSAMESLGADPTAQTPDADVTALASMGIPKVLGEPRSSVLQCLEAIQTAELTDNAAWSVLRDLCVSLGQTDMADEFSHALAQEEVHADTITEWVEKIALHQGGGGQPVHPDEATTH